MASHIYSRNEKNKLTQTMSTSNFLVQINMGMYLFQNETINDILRCHGICREKSLMEACQWHMFLVVFLSKTIAWQSSSIDFDFSRIFNAPSTKAFKGLNAQKEKPRKACFLTFLAVSTLARAEIISDEEM